MRVDALLMSDEKKIEIVGIDVGMPKTREVQIRVKACGVCAWDQFLFRGKDTPSDFPFYFGHEAVGTVLSVGEEVTTYKTGDTVFCIESVFPEMAQVINVPEERVCRLPDISERELPYYVLEPACCVVSGVQTIDIKPGARVAIIGTGYMGLLNVQAYRRSLISKLVCFDIDSRKLELAKKFGADACWLFHTAEGEIAMQQYIDEGGFDLVVECSASQDGLDNAVRLVKTGGTISNFAWHRGERICQTTPWHLRGIAIVNTSDARNLHFSEIMEPTVELTKAGVFDQHDLITHIYEYHHAQELFEIADRKKENYIKGVITF